MSRHARFARALLGGWLPCILVLVAPLASAQTIAEYSRAQRALLESTMRQAAARSAGLGASAPAVTASASATPPTSVPRIAMPAMAPAIQVSGVFASRGETVAEVVVNATAYLLGVGQGVPGTPWRVDAITIDSVVLSRPGGMRVADAEGARKVFPLPALR